MSSSLLLQRLTLSSGPFTATVNLTHVSSSVLSVLPRSKRSTCYVVSTVVTASQSHICLLLFLKVHCSPTCTTFLSPRNPSLCVLSKKVSVGVYSTIPLPEVGCGDFLILDPCYIALNVNFS